MTNDVNTPRALHLLSLCRTIRHYEDALARAQGAHFNIFDILHVGHYEVRTHSPILADLLDPSGTHGQGVVFLRLFLAQLAIVDFEAEDSLVRTEVGIGTHGRIDIIISDRRRESHIFIENKIYADLQDKQLERYQAHDSKARVLFLTLNGDVPPTEQAKVTPISYRHHIITWLEQCRKEAAIAPSVREVITQYIQLIQGLTHQNTNTSMNQELIAAVLQNKESYLAYVSLRNADWQIRKTLLSRVNNIVQSYAATHHFEVREVLALNGGQYESCFLTTPALKALNLEFGFTCDRSNYRDFDFGFKFIELDIDSPIRHQIESECQSTFGAFKTTKWWPVWQHWDQHRNWNEATMAAIISGDFKHDVEILFSRLAAIGANAIKLRES